MFILSDDCDASNIDVGFDHNTLSEDGLTDIDEVGCIQADGDVSVDVSTSSSVSRVVVSKVVVAVFSLSFLRSFQVAFFLIGTGSVRLTLFQ